MRTRYHIKAVFLSTLVGVVCLPGVVTGDDYNAFYQSRTTKYDTMEAIKKDISKLIAENNKLEAQYSKLKEKWNAISVNMQMNHHQGRQQSQDIFVQTRNVEVLPEKKRMTPLMQKQMIEGDLTNYNEATSLLELRLADLQYYRRELELELKMIEVQKKDNEREVLGRLDRLKADLQGAIQREKQLIQLISRKEKAIDVAPKEIPVLEAGNKNLEEAIIALEKKNEFKVRELAILQDKKLLKERASEEILSKVENEKVSLKVKVEDLQDAHSELSDSVSHSLQRQERKHELIQEIIFYDQENQKLQVRISELSDKIKYHDN